MTITSRSSKDADFGLYSVQLEVGLLCVLDSVIVYSGVAVLNSYKVSVVWELLEFTPFQSYHNLSITMSQQPMTSSSFPTPQDLKDLQGEFVPPFTASLDVNVFCCRRYYVSLV